MTLIMLLVGVVLGIIIGFGLMGIGVVSLMTIDKDFRKNAVDFMNAQDI